MQTPTAIPTISEHTRFNYKLDRDTEASNRVTLVITVASIVCIAFHACFPLF